MKDWISNMLKTGAMLVYLLFVNFSAVFAATYTFTATIDNNWNTPGNWSPSYPGTSIASGDEVIIAGDCIIIGVQNSGTLTVQDGFTLTISGYMSLTINSAGNLVNNGTFLCNSSGRIRNDGTITNKNSMTIKGELRNFPTSEFYNEKDLYLLGGGLIRNTLNKAFVNSDNFRVDDYSILENQYQGSLTNTGTLLIIRGTFSNMNSSNFINEGIATIQAYSTLTNMGLSKLVNKLGATLSVTRWGSINNESSATWDNFGTLNNQSGTITNKGSLINRQGATLNNLRGGISTSTLRHRAGSTFINEQGAFLNNGAKFEAEGTIENRGNWSVTWTGTMHIVNNFINTSTGVLTIGLICTLEGHLINEGIVENQHTLRITATGTFENRNATLTNQGRLMGEGELTQNGIFQNLGGSFIEPRRNGIGKLTLTGDLEMGGGNYKVEIDGAAMTSDTLAISGNVDLTGSTLSISWLNNPISTGTFSLMSFGSRTGTFGSVHIPPVPGYAFTTSFTPTSLILSVSVAPLPVELTSFTAIPNEYHEVQLQWQTESELNNEGFEVQASPDGILWQVLHFAEGRGNSTETQQYSFLDKNPYEGINYYRLKQMDYDGQFTYSSIVEAKVGVLVESISIVPNPAVSHKSTLYFSHTMKGKAVLSILDMSGKMLSRQNLDLSDKNKAFVLDVADVAAGLYVIRVDYKDRIYRKKLQVD